MHHRLEGFAYVHNRFLMPLLLNANDTGTTATSTRRCFSVFISDFDQLFACWDATETILRYFPLTLERSRQRERLLEIGN